MKSVIEWVKVMDRWDWIAVTFAFFSSLALGIIIYLVGSGAVEVIK